MPVVDLQLFRGKSPKGEPLETGKSTITKYFSTIRLMARIGFLQHEYWKLWIKTLCCFLCSKGAKILSRHRDRQGDDLLTGSLWRGESERLFSVGKITQGYVNVRFFFFFQQGLNLAGVRCPRGAWVKWRAMGFSLWQLCWLARQFSWLWWSSWTFSGTEKAGIKKKYATVGIKHFTW